MLTIGQLAKRVNLRTSTLRYYEDEGLLMPTSRSDSGYRLYDEAAEQTLRFIQRAQRLGFALGDIRQLLTFLDSAEPNSDQLVQLAEKRYLAIEKQMTEWLVLRHEMGLFLQDVHQHTHQHNHENAMVDDGYSGGEDTTPSRPCHRSGWAHRVRAGLQAARPPAHKADARPARDPKDGGRKAHRQGLPATESLGSDLPRRSRAPNTPSVAAIA